MSNSKDNKIFKVSTPIDNELSRQLAGLAYGIKSSQVPYLFRTPMKKEGDYKTVAEWASENRFINPRPQYINHRHGYMEFLEVPQLVSTIKEKTMKHEEITTQYKPVS
jgi:hypothetical protein